MTLRDSEEYMEMVGGRKAKGRSNTIYFNIAK